MRIFRLLSCIFLATAIGCTTTTSGEIPSFVNGLIEQMKSEPKSNPPSAIWRYNYKGGVVFYVPPKCCDIPSVLYAADGSVICSPDGGMTGRGDGKCPDFFETRSNEKRMWLDSR